jgi:uncharacterized membrane protein
MGESNSEESKPRSWALSKQAALVSTAVGAFLLFSELLLSVLPPLVSRIGASEWLKVVIGLLAVVATTGITAFSSWSLSTKKKKKKRKKKKKVKKSFS